MSPKIKTMRRKLLLSCGALASLLYIGMNIFIPPLYEGYNWVSQVVSELSAVDAPTRPIWFVLGIIYTLLIAAFGWGVLKSGGEKRSLRTEVRVSTREILCHQDGDCAQRHATSACAKQDQPTLALYDGSSKPTESDHLRARASARVCWQAEAQR